MRVEPFTSLGERQRAAVENAASVVAPAFFGGLYAVGHALPFLQLERAIQKMGGGDRAVGIAIESSKWIKGGFAVEKL